MVKELFLGKKEREEYAIWAALLIAIEPWSMFLSRGAFEANLAMSFFLMGAYFLLLGVRKYYALLLGGFFWGLTLWTYNSYRVFTPLMFVSFMIMFWHELKKIGVARIIFFVFTFLVFLIPMLWQMFGAEGVARYGLVKIIDEGAIGKIIDLRNASKFDPVLTRLLYNRPVYFFIQFIKNYWSHFSPDFLALKGGSHYQFSVPRMGLLYLVDIPFLIYGFWWLVKRIDRRVLFLFAWVFIAPIPSSLTREAPHVLRSITFLPIPMILTAVGVTNVKFRKATKGMTYFFFIFSLLVLFFAYMREYFVDYRIKYANSWQYGYKEVVELVMNQYADFDQILITKRYGEPHEFILFHSGWNPDSFQTDPNLIRFYQSNWYWVDKFDRFYFVNDWLVQDGMMKKIFRLESGDSVDCINKKCLLVTGGGVLPGSWRKFETIKSLDGMVMFEIYEN